MMPTADNLATDRTPSGVRAGIAACLAAAPRRSMLLAAASGACILAAGCAGGPELGPLDATGSLKALMSPVSPAPQSAGETPAAAGAGAERGATAGPAAPQPLSVVAGETPSVAGALSLSLAPNLARSDSPPLEVYARIVRHSRGCWFGLDGAIEASHVLHADAAPPEKGGRVVITIHERVVGANTIWGARAFEITLTPSGDGTDIATENVKLAGERAAAMSGDLEAWMHDKQGCRLSAASPVLANAAPPLPVRRPPQASNKPAPRNR